LNDAWWKRSSSEDDKMIAGIVGNLVEVREEKRLKKA
jgi:hypothetical protein